jgi:retron-type reverse transcriptase
MSRLADLQSAVSRSDVARLLHTTLKGLTAILYTTPIANRYGTFEIPKRGGGTRTIKAPDDKLKLLQRKLSILLQDCVDEINETKKQKDTVAHGFKRKRSILSNAKRHRHRRWVFNLDLQDFFPSIHFGRVRGFFIKDKNFALHPDVATIFAQIACDGNALPQGSPWSPVISNLIAHVLDMQLVRLAAKVGCSYSRYADDLTFSTNKKEFPAEIACKSEDGSHVWLPGSEIEEIIRHSDFRINARKTRMQYRDSRQDVTGLVVNRRINIRREYRHNVRAMVHSLFRTGKFTLYSPVTKDGKTTLELREGTLGELHGRLGFIDWIDVRSRRVTVEEEDLDRAPTKESTYRKFLVYRDFYTAKLPVVLCEGKTDNVYIKHAIRSMVAQFPDLAELDAKGKPRLKIRLYKYTRSSTGRILDLKDGGSSHLKKFITNYKKDTDKFAAPGLQNPLIVLFDNDSGAKPIWSVVKQARTNKQNINLKDPFTHVVKNLYVVPTPLKAGQKESKIEDFFDAATKATVVGGKTFSDKNDADETKHYGKWIFAEKVIAPNAKTIDFTGFVPLLQSISLVIQTHAKIFSSPASPPEEVPPSAAHA